MNKLSIYQKPVTFRGVIAFTVPTILMTLIQSSYSMIDGIFISNLLGELALSSLTLISPYFNFFIAVAAMFASGGSAVVMKKMGEKKGDEARQDFTMLMTANLIVGVLLMAVTMLFTGPLVSIFKASPEVTEYCREYLWAFGFFIIPQLLFSNLQIYTIASGKTKRAMFSAVFGGVFNIVFDYLLIGIFKGGMAGAAIASGFGMLIPCLILGAPLFQKKSMLHFTAPKFRLPVLIKTITNGFSEFSSNLVSGIVMLLFNGRMLRLAGENGVAASTITFYVFGLMSALYMGYMFGVSPLLSYFYGAGDREKMKKLRSVSLTLIAVVAVITTTVSILGSGPLVSVFTQPGSEAYTLAVSGNRLFSLALLPIGFNTFSSMLFTALSNGKISAVLAFSRTFVFLVAAILLLPFILGINGLWLSVPVSEVLALFLSGYYIKKNQRKYGY
jgi:putative MATE family efflux protein